MFKANINWLPFVQKAQDFLNLKRSANKAYFKEIDDSFFTKPFITIARDPGSGGAPIARSVAEKLGFELIDEKIIDEVAKSTKLRREIVKTIDEKNRSMIEDLVHAFLNPEYLGEQRYIRALFRVVLTYAHKGGTEIVGRGANFITPFAKGLHVWVTAPYETRVRRAMDFEGLDLETAKERIAKVEEERRDFVNQYISENARKPLVYDITINTRYFHISHARDIIISALHQKFSDRDLLRR